MYTMSRVNIYLHCNVLLEEKQFFCSSRLKLVPYTRNNIGKVDNFERLLLALIKTNNVDDVNKKRIILTPFS